MTPWGLGVLVAVVATVLITGLGVLPMLDDLRRATPPTRRPTRRRAYTMKRLCWLLFLVETANDPAAMWKGLDPKERNAIRKLLMLREHAKVTPPGGYFWVRGAGYFRVPRDW
jgi:hypothetical protein